MSASDNAVLAHRWFDEVWTQRRDATVVELLADPCEGHMEGGDVRGPRDFLAARAALLGAIPDLKVVVEGVIAQGDEVAIRWSASGTHRGDALGPKASGRETLFRGISWMRFQNGRIVEGWDSWNLGRLLDELSRPPADIELPDENPGAAGRG
ncbi:MAG TPA: ester cyclase [Thermoanaerobaculia bacterium]|nr:ester cyclase [Thermoanaerobaculia bacterium]